MVELVTTAVIPVTILAGQSLSSVIDCSNKQLVRIYTPPQWTPANLSMLISEDSVESNFRDMIFSSGAGPYFSCAPNTVIVVRENLEVLKNCFLRFRSGSAQVPIPQAADRTFNLVFFQ
jgi:hypothetical protein